MPRRPPVMAQVQGRGSYQSRGWAVSVSERPERVSFGDGEKGESEQGERKRERESLSWQISDAEKTKSHVGVRSFLRWGDVLTIKPSTKKPPRGGRLQTGVRRQMHVCPNFPRNKKYAAPVAIQERIRVFV